MRPGGRRSSGRRAPLCTASERAYAEVVAHTACPGSLSGFSDAMETPFCVDATLDTRAGILARRSATPPDPVLMDEKRRRPRRRHPERWQTSPWAATLLAVGRPGRRPREPRHATRPRSMGL